MTVCPCANTTGHSAVVLPSSGFESPATMSTRLRPTGSASQVLSERGYRRSSALGSRVGAESPRIIAPAWTRVRTTAPWIDSTRVEAPASTRLTCVAAPPMSLPKLPGLACAPVLPPPNRTSADPHPRQGSTRPRRPREKHGCGLPRRSPPACHPWVRPCLPLASNVAAVILFLFFLFFFS